MVMMAANSSWLGVVVGLIVVASSCVTAQFGPVLSLPLAAHLVREDVSQSKVPIYVQINPSPCDASAQSCAEYVYESGSTFTTPPAIQWEVIDTGFANNPGVVLPSDVNLETEDGRRKMSSCFRVSQALCSWQPSGQVDLSDPSTLEAGSL